MLIAENQFLQIRPISENSSTRSKETNNKNARAIQPSTWLRSLLRSSPVWVAPKHVRVSGEQRWRVVIDYRKLSEITLGDKYPLPNVMDLLDQLSKCSLLYNLRSSPGFHQIEKGY